MAHAPSRSSSLFLFTPVSGHALSSARLGEGIIITYMVGEVEAFQFRVPTLIEHFRTSRGGSIEIFGLGRALDRAQTGYSQVLTALPC